MPTVGWIWPKDPRPENPSGWPRHWRFWDVFTNKGPDIFVGKINGPTATKARNWHRWEEENHRNDQEHQHHRHHREQLPFPFFWGKHGSEEKYDFRMRKYHIPDVGTWSRVEYCDGPGRGRGRCTGGKHTIPLRYWDKNGERYPAYVWHDSTYGAHGDRADRIRRRKKYLVRNELEYEDPLYRKRGNTQYGLESRQIKQPSQSIRRSRRGMLPRA